MKKKQQNQVSLLLLRDGVHRQTNISEHLVSFPPTSFCASSLSFLLAASEMIGACLSYKRIQHFSLNDYTLSLPVFFPTLEKGLKWVRLGLRPGLISLLKICNLRFDSLS